MDYKNILENKGYIILEDIFSEEELLDVRENILEYIEKKNLVKKIYQL